MSAKEPLSDAAASALPKCKSSHQVDTAIVNGQEYDITGPERDTIISDMLVMPVEEFATKWAHVHKGLSSTHPNPSSIISTKDAMDCWTRNN